MSPTAEVHSAAPELLAPAGNMEAMRAAVANGADAVYFGLSGNNGTSMFNARFRAENFTLDSLPEVMDYLHSHNVRGYIAFNTLIFSDELPEAVRFLSAVAAAGADAVIVQDLGIAALLRRLCPQLPVHGSTQMTLTEPLGIELAKSLGVQRVILARELSVADITKITSATTVPVEVFVHGALCVAYSGQCLTSESLGGRSANRGQCAQACRLPYDLVVDGQMRDLGEMSYLLSPQDLAAHDLIGELAAANVVSVKIEGRLKSAHYVAATTQAYRAAIDAAERRQPFRLSQEQQQELAQTFSRGFTHGFLDGVNHQELVHARFPKSRGLRMGRVVGRTAAGIVIEFESGAGGGLKPGDGVVFDEGHPEQDEQGGRVFSVKPIGSQQSRRAEVGFGRGAVNLAAIAQGSLVWKTDDPAVRRKVEQSYSRDRVVRRLRVHVRLTAHVGGELIAHVRDDEGNAATASWAGPLVRAERHPLSAATVREQFGRLGDTPFELSSVEINGVADGDAEVMVPKSVLNDVRRRAIAELLEKRVSRAARPAADGNALTTARAEMFARFAARYPKIEGPRQLYAMVRTMAQLEAVLAWKSPDPTVALAGVYCEMEDIRKYPAAVAAARAAGVPIALATLRIIKPAEHGLLRQVAAAGPDAVLVRNLAGVSLYASEFPELPLIGDYSLNIANELTAAVFAERGLRRMVPSYDLSWKQLAAMLQQFPPGAFEVVIHQHMPMFHMEHCVFCHTLSSGTDYRDCGRPCESHQVDLRDRATAAHPLLADVGCRNTVYNGTAQSAAEYVPQMKRLGICHFRVELLRESAAEATELLDRYARVLAGLDEGRATWRQLKVLNQLGVTRGTLE
jgi:putative protease